MKNKIQIVDVTLRDGGFTCDFDWPMEFAQEYYNKGLGGKASVNMDVMRGRAMTKEQRDEIEGMIKGGDLSIQRKRGGTVKRNIGGPVRGVGKAMRGFGNANYSKKMY